MLSLDTDLPLLAAALTRAITLDFASSRFAGVPCGMAAHANLEKKWHNLSRKSDIAEASLPACLRKSEMRGRPRRLWGFVASHYPPLAIFYHPKEPAAAFFPECKCPLVEMQVRFPSQLRLTIHHHPLVSSPFTTIPIHFEQTPLPDSALAQFGPKMENEAKAKWRSRMNEAALTPPQAPSPDAGQIPMKPRRRSAAVPNDDEWLVSLPRLCELLHLPERWLRRLVAEGKLPVMKVGNRLAFDPKQVKSHLKNVAKYNRFGDWPKDPRPEKH
jgi:hypothetical protein